MPDSLLIIDVNIAELVTMLGKAGDLAADALKGVALETAQAIAREAHARAERHRVTGETVAGLHVEPTYDGTGYVVVEDPVPGKLGRKVPRFEEHGVPGRMAAIPFFDNSAKLEEGPWLRRIDEVLRRVLSQIGDVT